MNVILVLDKPLGVYAVHYDGLRAETVRYSAAHTESLLITGVVGVGYTLLDGLSLQLSENYADIQHCPAHRRGSVEFLC